MAKKIHGGMMMNDQIEQLIEKYPPDIQAITQTLRDLLRKIMPGAYESIYHGALSYSLSPSPFERLIYLAIEKSYVRFGFDFGSYLPDPAHLLVGEGKRLRHVKVYSIADASQPALKQLVLVAWENGGDHVAQMKSQLQIRRSFK